MTCHFGKKNPQISMDGIHICWTPGAAWLKMFARRWVFGAWHQMISVFSLRLERLRKKRQTSNETCRRVMDFFTTSFDVFFDFFWELDMCTFFLRYIYIYTSHVDVQIRSQHAAGRCKSGGRTSGCSCATWNLLRLLGGGTSQQKNARIVRITTIYKPFIYCRPFGRGSHSSICRGYPQRSPWLSTTYPTPGSPSSKQFWWLKFDR